MKVGAIRSLGLFQDFVSLGMELWAGSFGGASPHSPRGCFWVLVGFGIVISAARRWNV